MVEGIEALVAEIAGLREDNEALRQEVRDAVAMLERGSSALAGAPARRARRRAADADGESAVAPRSRAGGPTRGTRRRAAGTKRGRATDPRVTPQVVVAAIGKLGAPTAAEIATEVKRHLGNVNLNGRSIRWIAEGAGVKYEDIEGQRRYKLG